ncbi:TetR/AcrR family transcriptional regulator [Promicromonospora sukumoe]|uniref:TetR/AcrR family transcriptional regulator n=1 Tax=Promicromonospora sukumoe TaxID=88382 RepID=UPI0037C85642
MTSEDGTPPARDRIVGAATALFYAHGIRAVSADRIIERAKITKVTFYRYFRTKDDLVVAYLEQQAARERAAVERIRESAADSFEALGLLAQRIEAESRRTEFRGCPFINAAAEYADPAGPVRKVVARQRSWYRDTFAEMLKQGGVPDPAEVAQEVALLRDGAMVSGSLDTGGNVGQALTSSILAVTNAHRPAP